MASDINRRKFMGSAAASGAFAIVPRHVLGGAGYVPPSDKITLAHIGMGTQGFRELESLLASPGIQALMWLNLTGKGYSARRTDTCLTNRSR